jgi:hypothetical protein
MSDPWFRLGRQPNTGTGLDGAPVTPVIGYFLVYSDSKGELVTHSYDAATGVFTPTVTEDHVVVVKQTGLFEIYIDDAIAMRLQTNILRVKKFSEKGAALEPSVLFKRARRSVPETLAVLTKSGVLSVGKILQSSTFGVQTDRFRFFNGGLVKATIGSNGLQAADIKEETLA